MSLTDTTLRNTPNHVAIIMDGNGRWAAARKLPRFRGHLEGTKRVEEITRVAGDLGIKVLTLFTFSTENWQRPRDEVSMLMSTLCSALGKKLEKFQKENVRFNVIGRREGIPAQVLRSLQKAVDATRTNTGLVLNLAFNYGGRAEILDAVRKIAQEVRHGTLKVSAIDEQVFSEALYTKGLVDPDLLIRTSGEQRISNFLLWQLSYAELYFTETFWPDFDEQEFKKALLDYQTRERRYGRVRETGIKAKA